MEKLQSSNFTVAETFCSSICSLFSFLTPSQRQFVKNNKEINSLCNTVSSGRLIESLVQQSIGFTTSPNFLCFGEELKLLAQNSVPSFEDIDQWKIVVDGPAHSGKSTILSLIAKEAIQSLSSCNKLSKVFIFAVNWEIATQRLTDIYSLYDYLAAQTVFYLTWQYPKIYPIAQSLLNWLLSIPNSSILPTLPLRVQNLPLFPLTAVEVYGKQVFNALKNTSNPINLVKEIVSLPTLLASCFGFQKFLLIYDHLDLANMDVRVADDSTQPVCIIDAIVSVLSDHLFFFSMKSPQGIIDIMKDIDYGVVHVENSISPNLVNGVRTINCYKPKINLNIDMCQGCPQFVNKYLNIVQYIQEVEKLADESKQKCGFVSAVANTKMKLAKMLTIELCTDFFYNGSNVIDDELLSQMRENSNFTVSLGKNKSY